MQNKVIFKREKKAGNPYAIIIFFRASSNNARAYALHIVRILVHNASKVEKEGVHITNIA